MTYAGKLDRVLTFQRATVNYNAYNEQIETWNLLVTVFAGKRDVSAGESLRAQEVGAQLTTRFVARHSDVLTTLTARDRLMFEGKLYNITGVREVQDTRNAWIEIDAVARNDAPAVVTSP